MDILEKSISEKPLLTAGEVCSLFSFTMPTMHSHLRDEDSKLGEFLRRARRKYGRRVFFIRDVVSEAWQEDK